MARASTRSLLLVLSWAILPACGGGGGGGGGPFVPSFQDAYLKASNTDMDDKFGSRVAVSGDILVVGAPEEDSSATGVNGNGADNSVSNAGAAYVYARTGGVWTQEAYLKASSVDADDQFGSAVAISGDTVVIGVSGEDSSATGVNGNAADNSVSAAGAAYVFRRSGGVWSQEAYLKASITNAMDGFGGSVAISGDTIVVGAVGEDGISPNSGAAYVFVRSGGVWTEEDYLKASNAENGDRFGESVSISGDILIVGATWEDSGATGVNGNEADNFTNAAGAAYVFTRTGGVWTQEAYLKASNSDFSDGFGWSVAISGDLSVVGAVEEASSATGVNGNQADNSLPFAGAAYVFKRTGGVWAQEAYLKASNTGNGDRFGWSVAIAGHSIVVGAPGEWSNATGLNGNEADNSIPQAGAGYVFTRTGSGWNQDVYVKASNTEGGDQVGWSGAISGDTLVLGANSENSSATGVNGNEADNSALASGAAYVYR